MDRPLGNGLLDIDVVLMALYAVDHDALDRGRTLKPRDLGEPRNDDV